MPAVAELIRPDTSFVAANHEADARSRLIVALDFDDIPAARELVRKLGNEIVFYKIGLGLQLNGGDEFVKELKRDGKKVFLDYKYYDIGETIRRAVARAAEFDVDFLTVHGVTHILKSAVQGRDEVRKRLGHVNLKIFCVTVLTSMDATDLREEGFSEKMTVESLVVHRAKNALKAGVDGVIASAREVEKLKSEVSDQLIIVTPGIRSEHAGKDDQKRTATPYDAIKSGADYLVIGREITKSPDPVQSAHQIVLEMAKALAEA